MSMTAADEEVSKSTADTTLNMLAPARLEQLSMIVRLKIREPANSAKLSGAGTEWGFLEYLSDDSSPLSSLHSSPVLDPMVFGEDHPNHELKLENEIEEYQLSSMPVPVGKLRSKSSSKNSPYFPKSPREKVSCIPFPSLESTSFGLVQERLCHDPFRLLVATIFLNKTRGSVSMPVFFDVMTRYPKIADLAAAKHGDLLEMIQHLGLQNQRANKCIRLAQAWLESPPQRGKRYRRMHYPKKDDGKDVIPSDGPIDDEDPRVAWEIGHLPGIGAYAIDSWRIFCRDELRGRPTGLPEESTPESIKAEMEKEWTRVLPLDKELRAYLRWRWLRLGWEFNPLTGERKAIDQEFYKKVERGGVILEGDQHWSVEAVPHDIGKVNAAMPLAKDHEMVEEGDLRETGEVNNKEQEASASKYLDIVSNEVATMADMTTTTASDWRAETVAKAELHGSGREAAIEERGTLTSENINTTGGQNILENEVVAHGIAEKATVRPILADPKEEYRLAPYVSEGNLHFPPEGENLVDYPNSSYIEDVVQNSGGYCM